MVDSTVIVLKAGGTSKGHPVFDVITSAVSFGLALLMFVFSIGSGCATRPLEEAPGSDKKVSAPVSIEICNPEADRAMRLEEYENSIRIHERVLQKEPANRLALYHLGYVYGLTGNHEQEVHYYEEAVALGLKKKNIFFNLGMAYGALNQLEKARLAFEKGLEIDPDSSDNYFGLALIYQELGDDKSAEGAFLRAIRIDPEDVDARLELSLLYADRGDFKQAAYQLRKILEIDPHHDGAREFLQKIEQEGDQQWMKH
jgi:tetratricopeptide (TPR) repeat protein